MRQQQQQQNNNIIIFLLLFLQPFVQSFRVQPSKACTNLLKYSNDLKHGAKEKASKGE